jgi:hypothetical protein
MIYFTLTALATLIYAGAWMLAAPSKALMAVNRISNEISRFDQTTLSLGAEPVRESTAIRVAFRLAGLVLVLLSVMRLAQIT